ncbi:MAG: hypothetical protein J07HQX50_01958 [Haloquadratum sp. J07HQX50]|nr:MAG: hypothetical protein J07HQX50_01958 [Haloquadratum sp. J07HQX50]
MAILSPTVLHLDVLVYLRNGLLGSVCRDLRKERPPLFPVGEFAVLVVGSWPVSVVVRVVIPNGVVAYLSMHSDVTPRFAGGFLVGICTTTKRYVHVC